MSNIIYTKQSEEDLEEIADFIAKDSVNRALSYLEKMQKSIELIAKNPHIGIACREKKIDLDCRVWIFESYLVFYKVLENAILILRVLHSSVNYKKILV
jgi:toxin ParE1/3/4